MKLADTIIVLSNILVATLQFNASDRNVYLLEKEARRAYPLFYSKYYKRYDTNRYHNNSAFISALSSLRLLSVPFCVLRESDELNFKEGNYQQKALWSLRGFEGEALQNIIKDLTFRELVSLLKLRRERNIPIVIDVDDEFEDIFSSFPSLLEAPILERVRNFINHGVSLDILKKLASSGVKIFLENAQLNLWRRPLGDFLLEYTLLGHIKYYDPFALNYLEENYMIVQSWIALAEQENLPTETIVLMLDFPELAEHIYKTPHSDVLRNIFTGGISSWRRVFAEKVNWNHVKWTNEMKKGLQADCLLSLFRGDIFFDHLILSCQHTDIISKIFGDLNPFLELKASYIYKKLLNERQELVYLRLKNRGYPIGDIFTIPNDELEGQIWEHFKIHSGDMDWVKVKALEVVRNKLSLFYSQAALGGKDLVDGYFKRCSADERNELFSTLNENLNEYFEQSIRVYFKKSCALNDPSCIIADLSNAFGGDYFARFKEAYLRQIDLDQFYPKIIEKLGRDRDLISRNLLFETLELLVTKKLSAVYQKIIKALRHNCQFYNIEEPTTKLQAWSDNIGDLAKNIKRHYLSYHPEDIFRGYCLDKAIRVDTKILTAFGLDPDIWDGDEDEICHNESSLKDEPNFTKDRTSSLDPSSSASFSSCDLCSVSSSDTDYSS